MITVVATVTAWIHYWRLRWPAAIGPGIGVIGIAVAIIAHRRAARAVADVTVRTRPPRPVPPSLAS